MRLVEQYAQDPSDGSNAGTITEAFRRVRHFVGRLAARIRIPQQLLDDASRVPHLLECCRVKRAPSLTAAALPPADDQTRLDCILGRMIARTEPRYADLLEHLNAIDTQRHIMAKVMSKYKPKMVPCVHAEITLLEHFHRLGLDFAARDRFIVCSKPACFCCRLYFRHHPSHCVEPDSHEKVYVRWGPPALFNPAKDSPEFLEQRKLLASMITDIKQVALNKIENPDAVAPAHPDSVTGFTPSENGDYYDFDSDSEWDFGFDTSDYGKMILLLLCSNAG
jgi:hypothetical protein